MAFPIDSPLPIFYDRNGDVLDAGYVYVGTVNLNPETNPIAVYWDEAQTIPAPQPLRTVRGFIARNGAPANLYVTTDFSLVVRDSNRALVLSAQNSASIDRTIAILGEPSGSSMVGFLQAGTGAEPTTVQEELRYFVRPEQFGAVADGVTDDLAPITEALVYAKASRLPIVFSGKTYVVNGAITFDLTDNSFIGNGARLDFSGAPDGIACVTVLDGSLMKLNHTISGFDFRGIGPSSTQIGMLFQGPTTGTAGITSVSNCTWVNFGVGCQWGNNAFLQSFVQCYWRTCGICVYVPAGIADFAENISFTACVFGSTPVHMDLSECEVYCYGTSFDYASAQHIICRSAANITLSGGHVEGSQDTDYWLEVTGPDSSMTFYGVEFAVASSATKTSFPLGYSDANAASAINLFDCEFTGFNGTTYQFPYLIEGYGRANGIAYYLGGSGATGDALGAITHTRLNLLSDFSFEQTTLRDFYNVQTSPATTSTGAARIGTRSMLLQPTAGTICDVEFQAACAPGDQPIFIYYMQGSGFVGDAVFVELQYFDAYFNLLGTASQTIAAGSVPATWARFQLRSNAIAPPGVAFLRFSISKSLAVGGNSDGNGLLYVDTVYAQILGSGGNSDSKEYRFTRSAVTSNNTFRVPNNYALEGVKILNTTANAVTGGIRIGTTGGGTQVATSIAVGANADLFIPSGDLLLSYFSSTANQTLFFEAVTAWNSASLNVSFVCRRVG